MSTSPNKQQQQVASSSATAEVSPRSSDSIPRSGSVARRRTSDDAAETPDSTLTTLQNTIRNMEASLLEAGFPSSFLNLSLGASGATSFEQGKQSGSGSGAAPLVPMILKNDKDDLDQNLLSVEGAEPSSTRPPSKRVSLTGSDGGGEQQQLLTLTPDDVQNVCAAFSRLESAVTAAAALLQQQAAATPGTLHRGSSMSRSPVPVVENGQLVQLVPSVRNTNLNLNGSTTSGIFSDAPTSQEGASLTDASKAAVPTAAMQSSISSTPRLAEVIPTGGAKEAHEENPDVAAWLNENFSQAKAKKKKEVVKEERVERNVNFLNKSAEPNALSPPSTPAPSQLADGPLTLHPDSANLDAEEPRRESTSAFLSISNNASHSSGDAGKFRKFSNASTVEDTGLAAQASTRSDDSSSGSGGHFLNAPVSPSGIYARKSLMSRAKSSTNDQTRIKLKEHNIPWLDVDNIDFDIFKVFDQFNKSFKDTFLFVSANVLFRYYFIFSMNMDTTKMINFLKDVQMAYRDENPYHNSIHAADVLQTTHIYLCNNDVRDNFSTEEVLCVLFSAIVHDVGHLGIANAFLVKTHHPLASIYNDSSPLESMHAALAFHLLSKPQNNFFDGAVDWDDDRQEEFRAQVLQVVVGTDMKFHQSCTASVIDILADGVIEDDEMGKLLCAIVHAADLSNPMKPIHIYKNWCDRVLAEFWQQGDAELEKKLPISMMCDRNNCAVAASQVGFINFIVKPFMGEFSMLLPDKWLERLESNLDYMMNHRNENYDTSSIEKLSSRKWVDNWYKCPLAKMFSETVAPGQGFLMDPTIMRSRVPGEHVANMESSMASVSPSPGSMMPSPTFRHKHTKELEAMRTRLNITKTVCLDVSTIARTSEKMLALVHNEVARFLRDPHPTKIDIQQSNCHFAANLLRLLDQDEFLTAPRIANSPLLITVFGEEVGSMSTEDKKEKLEDKRWCAKVLRERLVLGWEEQSPLLPHLEGSDHHGNSPVVLPEMLSGLEGERSIAGDREKSIGPGEKSDEIASKLSRELSGDGNESRATVSRIHSMKFKSLDALEQSTTTSKGFLPTANQSMAGIPPLTPPAVNNMRFQPSAYAYAIQSVLPTTEYIKPGGPGRSPGATPQAQSISTVPIAAEHMFAGSSSQIEFRLESTKSPTGLDEGLSGSLNGGGSALLSAVHTKDEMDAELETARDVQLVNQIAFCAKLWCSVVDFSSANRQRDTIQDKRHKDHQYALQQFNASAQLRKNELEGGGSSSAFGSNHSFAGAEYISSSVYASALAPLIGATSLGHTRDVHSALGRDAGTPMPALGPVRGLHPALSPTPALTDDEDDKPAPLQITDSGLQYQSPDTSSHKQFQLRQEEVLLRAQSVPPTEQHLAQKSGNRTGELRPKASTPMPGVYSSTNATESGHVHHNPPPPLNSRNSWVTKDQRSGAAAAAPVFTNSHSTQNNSGNNSPGQLSQLQQVLRQHIIPAQSQHQQVPSPNAPPILLPQAQGVVMIDNGSYSSSTTQTSSSNNRSAQPQISSLHSTTRAAEGAAVPSAIADMIEDDTGACSINKTPDVTAALVQQLQPHSFSLATPTGGHLDSPEHPPQAHVQPQPNRLHAQSFSPTNSYSGSGGGGGGGVARGPQSYTPKALNAGDVPAMYSTQQIGRANRGSRDASPSKRMTVNIETRTGDPVQERRRSNSAGDDSFMWTLPELKEQTFDMPHIHAVGDGTLNATGHSMNPGGIVNLHDTVGDGVVSAGGDVVHLLPTPNHRRSKLLQGSPRAHGRSLSSMNNSIRSHHTPVPEVLMAHLPPEQLESSRTSMIRSLTAPPIETMYNPETAEGTVHVAQTTTTVVSDSGSEPLQRSYVTIAPKEGGILETLPQDEVSPRDLVASLESTMNSEGAPALPEVFKRHRSFSQSGTESPKSSRTPVNRQTVSSVVVVEPAGAGPHAASGSNRNSPNNRRPLVQDP